MLTIHLQHLQHIATARRGLDQEIEHAMAIIPTETIEAEVLVLTLVFQKNPRNLVPPTLNREAHLLRRMNLMFNLNKWI